MGSNARVIRLNIKERVSQKLAPKYGAKVVPTFIVFDAAGVEQFRQSGEFPNREAILAAVRGP